MSDEEDVRSADEESEEEEDQQSTKSDEEDSKPTPAAPPARRITASGLDEESQELLDENRKEREGMEAEIRELRDRSERRKKERAEEETQQAERRAEEEASRKAAEEEKRAKLEEEETKRKQMRDMRKQEFAIMAQEEQGGEEKKSKEQLENEKRAILAQRIKPLEIDGANESKLQEEAKRLHKEIFRLESEKYDLEKRFKDSQIDMMELAERARNINKVGKGGLKRIQLGPEESDRIQEMIAGAPAKIEMFSKYERQKDKRSYGEKSVVFTGPTWCFPAEKVKPARRITWNPDTGLPEYEEIEGAGQEEAAPTEEVAE